MKYILTFFLIYAHGIRTSNSSLINYDNISIAINVNEKIENNYSYDYTSNNGNVQKRASSKNTALLIKVASYLFVFIFGFICAILFYNLKIRILLDNEFDTYKREYRGNNGKFSVLLIWLIKILKKHKDDYKTKLEKYKSMTNETILPKVGTQFPATKKSVRSLEKINFGAEDEIISPTKSWNVLSENKEHIKPPIEKKLTVQFYSVPGQDGSFAINNASITPLSRSYYKVEHYEGDTHGKLIYRSGDLDISAISQMDLILGPACEIENSSMSNPANIEVKSEGKVIRENDQWRIVKKIKLKLS